MQLLEQYPLLKELHKITDKKKVRIFLVGGFLRDFLLNRQGMDFDFAVEKNAISLAKNFSQKIKGAFVLLDQENGCARVVKKTFDGIQTFDFADFRAKTFKEDLKHRDFTINALALDFRVIARSEVTKQSKEIATPQDRARNDTVKLIDVNNGLSDLKQKIIRMSSANVLKEDPLRLLRAFSIRAVLDFKIEAKTLTQIKKNRRLIKDVSAERVRDEFFKILASSRAGKILEEMDKIGFLQEIIPQLSIMFNVNQGGYHHLDVWKHTLEAVKQFDQLMIQLKDNSDIRDYLSLDFGANHPRAALIKFALLLHDIGKPETRREEKDRMSFHGHEHVGRNIARPVAKMLKCSTAERHALEDMVVMHLRPGYLSNFKQPSERMVFRFFRDARDEAVSILLLSLADQRATRGPLTSEADQRHHEKICLSLVERYFRLKKQKPMVRLINGHDLIRKLKLKPSPLFSKILKKIEEKQALGKISTKEEALELARGMA